MRRASGFISSPAHESRDLTPVGGLLDAATRSRAADGTAQGALLLGLKLTRKFSASVWPRECWFEPSFLLTNM